MEDKQDSLYNIRDILLNNKLCHLKDNVSINNIITPNSSFLKYIICINNNRRYFYKKLSLHADNTYYKHELSASIYFSSMRLSPKVLYYDEKNMVIIYEYICSTHKSVWKNLKQIVALLKKLHHVTSFNNNEILKIKRNNCIYKYSIFPEQIRSDFYKLYEVAINLQNNYNAKDAVVSHNDFHFGNILIKKHFLKSNIYFIDFDSVDINSKYYDLATLIMSLRLNKSQECTILKMYDEKYDYNEYTKQKKICVARYAITELCLISDFANVDNYSISSGNPFSFRCKDSSGINNALRVSAYNWLNYFNTTF